MISAVRKASPEKVVFFYGVMAKNFEKMFDSSVKPAYTIKSDRGNPTDL
jgi:hypothetical protein